MNKKNVPYDMLLILFGIISILLCYAFAFPFTIDIIFLLVGVMVVFLLLSWIIKSGNKKAFYAFLILFIVFLVITRDSLVIGFQNLYNQMTEIYSTYDNYYFQKYNLDRYTNYQMTTERTVITPKKHNFTSIIYSAKNDTYYRENPYNNIDVVDRIGSGDAYVSGALYGYLKHGDCQKALEYGNAMAAIKHSVIGDMVFTDLVR